MARIFTPGLLSRGDAGAINSLARQTDDNTQRLDQLATRSRVAELTPVRLLSSGAGSGSGAGAGSGSAGVVSYDWIEQDFRRDGSRYDKADGLRGTAAWMPARHP